MNPVLVQVPCRRFQVVVKLGPPDGIGHLESSILRSLGLAPARLQDVAGLFSLPESLVLDRIVALFHHGLVTLQQGGQQIALSERVIRAMGDPSEPAEDWQKKLNLPAPISKEVELYRELVSGTVFPRPRPDNPRWQHRIPPDLNLPPVDEIPRPVLLSAASSKLRDERTGMRNLRAFDVTCGSGADGESTGATAETYASIVVEVIGFNLDGDHPLFSVIGPSTIGRRVRDAIADGISSLYQRGLVSGLVDALRAGATDDLEVANTVHEDPEAATATLRELVSTVAPNATPAAFLEQHEHAVTMAREIDDAFNAEAAQEGGADVLVGAPAHRRLLLDALREGAQHQVVIAAPRIVGLARDDEMKDALLSAVSRGVRVHLLWGEGQAKASDELGPLRELLELLRPREQKVGGLFVSERPAALHASAFASDLRRVVVGSSDWFGAAATNLQTLGILLPSVSSNDVTDPRTRIPTAVIETLQALRQACPEAALRSVIATDPVLDGGRPIVRERSPMAFPGIPAQIFPLAIRVWKDEWTRWLRDLETTRRSELSTVKLVPRGGHRRRVVRALKQAQRRILIMSPRLGDGVLGAAIEPYIMEALTRRVEVTFWYRDVVPREDLTRRLRQYRDRGLRTMHCDLEGSFIVWDERAIVGSFQFGTSDSERGLVELGFDVRDPKLASQLARLATPSSPVASSTAAGQPPSLP